MYGVWWNSWAITGPFSLVSVICKASEQTSREIIRKGVGNIKLTEAAASRLHQMIVLCPRVLAVVLKNKEMY